MHCPFCAHEETKVIDSRLAGEGRQIRRRRQCLACNERFTTFETAELVMPRLIKNDSSRQPFDENKLRNSMIRALEKRPVPSDQLEEAIGHVIHKLRTMGEREVSSRLVGELVMEELRALDEVAYVRFASVYRRFQDITEFEDEIKRLQRIAHLSLLEMYARESIGGIVTHLFIDGTLEDRADRPACTMMHAVAQFEIAQCKFGIIDVRVERVQLRLIEPGVLRNLGIEALERFEVVTLVGVKQRFAKIRIVQRFVALRGRRRNESEQQARQ